MMGEFLIVLSGIVFALDSYFGKLVLNRTDMSGSINSFSRFTLGLIVMVIYIVIKKKSFKAPDLKPIFNRAAINSIEMLLFAISLGYTTITNGNMLHMTYPIFVMLLAPIITKEEVNKKAYIYLILITLGSYAVINPKFGSINKGDLLALVSAVLGAISLLYLTEASRNNETYIVVFYVMLFGVIFNLPFAIKDIMSFDVNGVVPILIGAGCWFAGQVLITVGYRTVDTPTGSLISSSRIAMSALVGILLLGEPFNFRIMVGIILITLSLVGASGFFEKKIISE